MDTPTPTPADPRPAEVYVPELAAMQEHIGDLNAAITRSVSDGTLTFIERSELRIRLRGIVAHCHDLLDRLA